MRSLSLAALLLLIVVVAVPAQDQKGKITNSQTPMPVGPITGDKIKPGAYTGKLLSVPNAENEFTVEITTQVVEPKPNAGDLITATQKFQYDYQNGMQNIQRDLQSDRNNTQYHLNRLRDHQNWYVRHLPNYQPGGSHHPLQVKNVVQSVDFRAARDVAVRLLELPPEFDDAGKLKKRTQNELTKLKGKDRFAPGYEAKKEDLLTGALVKVTLARIRLPKGQKAADLSGQPRNHVTQVVIVSQDGKPPEPGAKGVLTKKK